VGGQPLFEDEAVAGLIAARPLPEVLATVLEDRGGAPLHFVLSHFALMLDSSAAALRWLSVVFALATIPLCYDLGRRLAGRTAGAVAAVVAATSTMLSVYGGFGRMYSLFAFVSALALVLFVRALEQRSGRAALAAAAAAWLVPAVHPYGILLVAAEAVVALAVWRGRPFRPALPILLLGGTLVPLLWADFRLAERFSVGVEGGASLAAPVDAWSQLARALAASAGGAGGLLVLFLVLGAVGLVACALRNPAFAAVALLALLSAPVLLILLGTGRASGLQGLSPRHLTFALPIWAALIGVAVAALLPRARPALAVAAVAALAACALFAPSGGVQDPRSIPDNLVLGGGEEPLALGSPEALAVPTAWLRERVGDGDLLFPFSSAFLAALPEAGAAVALPRSDVVLLSRALDRVELPARDLYLAIPLVTARARIDAVRARLGPRFDVEPFGGWLLVRAEGPFAEKADVLAPAFRVLRVTASELTGRVRPQTLAYLTFGYSVVCDSLRLLGERCVDAPRAA
jgi:hypothetical protein